ncbi:MAG: tetratricopeptide repeat protein [Hyphomicrobium sp.]
MVDNNDNLLREVEEELRRERLEKLWKQYGNYVIGAAALIVIVVLGYKYLEKVRIEAAEAAGAQYAAAMTLKSDGKKEEAAKAFETLANEGPSGYRALAQLQLASLLNEQGKKAEALAAYEVLAKDSSADSLLSGFAALQAASIRLGEADWTEMQNRLNDLAADDSPWRYNARELLGLAAFKAGKPDEARKILGPLLADEKTPQGVIDRAQIVMGQIVATDLAKQAAVSGPDTPKAAAEASTTAAPSGNAAAASENAAPSEKKE